MRKYTIFSFIALATMLLSSCSLLEGVFKGGFYIGVFAVLFVIFIIGFIIFKFLK